MSEMVISISDLSKKVLVGNKKEPIEILHNVSFSANKGEFISIVGPSGSGKSTLLNCISGLSKPTSGSISVLGINPYKLKGSKIADFRRNKIGFIFQSYNLIPSLPAFDNIVLPLKLAGKLVNKADIYQLMKSINFDASPNSFTQELSGGERQKVAIMRVLVARAQIIFADEPTGALDTASKKIIFGLLQKLAENGACVLMVTHDIEMAAETDKALILRDGQLRVILQHPNAQMIFDTISAEKG
ncbi:MAG: ABC transporter ATP-binding protein [Lentilactobacillus buchneri]|jgi:putative ABC transport system ATP-binding protein|nr:ABC transporter ATP-binding protein [Lentilactobacillus buchneri]MCI1950778.1 ABC transporter ATP-binding protein [Lentilactobacillus buchneri]MCI2019398.1 ABC transporter ATP-binding protein [Lentilactobacillus buchneri]MCI2028030.1 ABC transporter ATP-binding protein [Lentilactobacillus buchneri]